MQLMEPQLTFKGALRVLTPRWLKRSSRADRST